MALEKPEDIEALADALTGLASVFHDCIMDAIKVGKADQATTQALFQQESSLRQKANSLYANAINCVVSGLDLEQKDLLGVVEAAKRRIKAIEDIQKAMELAGDLIVLGASVVAGKPGPILAAVKEIKGDLG
jgi:hypothetical protein